MKRTVSIVVVLILLLAGQVYAGSLFDSHDINQSQGQAQGQVQGQIQGQGQLQGQNNDQVISPSQTLTVNAPSKVMVGTIPNVPGSSELYFISPNERDVQTILPRFGTGVIEPLKASDCIVDVLWIDSDIKFKGLYKAVLKGLRSDQVLKLDAKSVRYQIREAHSTKSWTTGGSIQGGGVGDVGTSLGGMSGGIIPQIGRSKSSNLYTVIFVQVQTFKK